MSNTRRANSDDDLRDLVAGSIDLIAREQSPSGAYPASPNFAVYQFAWLRDGSFIADGLSAHGHADSPTAFHDWTARVIVERAERIAHVVAALTTGGAVLETDYLPTRYTLAGADGPDEWWDFQLDGYGTWLWALLRHVHRHGLDVRKDAYAIGLVARYLAAAWRRPCYDWWEEHPQQVHVATLAAIRAGLLAALRADVLDEPALSESARAAAQIQDVIETEGCLNGRLRKWIGSAATDASVLAAVAPFEIVDAATSAQTVAAIEADLLYEGGVYRYREDVFYGGGRWPVLAGLLGESYIRLNRPQLARDQLAWIAGTADADGMLPEQVSDRLLSPAHLDEWVDKWGTVATPLLWSHGAYLSLAAKLAVML